MRVLVVDDELDIEDLFLQKFRHEIRSNEFLFSFRHSGEAALEYLESNHSETILILSDINMPGMNGIELLRRIKTTYENPSPIVMMITAYGDEASHNQAMKFGADDFLSKPVDFLSLKEKLKSKNV